VEVGLQSWREGSSIDDEEEEEEESLSDSDSDSLSDGAPSSTESFWRERDGEKRGSRAEEGVSDEEEERDNLFAASMFSIGFGFERLLECVEPMEGERLRFTTW
jgi:hypothetical protein